MKKLGKRGFTLVELLVVLVILSIIMAIAIPSVTSSIERSKQKQKDSKIELIKSAAEIYADRNKSKCEENERCIVSVRELVCNEKLLTSEQAKDPTNDKYTLGGYVSYDINGNYNWVENNDNNYRVNIDDGC